MLPRERLLESTRIPHVIHRETRTKSQMDDIPSQHPLRQFANRRFCQPETEGIAHRLLIGGAPTQSE